MERRLPADSVGEHFNEFSRTNSGDRYLDFLQNGQDVFHAVSDVDYDDGSDSDLAEPLLMPKALIGGEDDGEAPIDRSSKQDTIAQPLHPFAPNNRRSELDEMRFDLLRN